MIKHPSDIFKISGKPEFGNPEHIATLKRIEEVKKDGYIKIKYIDRIRDYERRPDSILIKDMVILGVGALDREGNIYSIGDGEFKEGKWPKINPDISCLNWENLKESGFLLINNKELILDNLIKTEPPHVIKGKCSCGEGPVTVKIEKKPNGLTVYQELESFEKREGWKVFRCMNCHEMISKTWIPLKPSN